MWKVIAEDNGIEGPDYTIHPEDRLSLPYSCNK